MKKLFLVGISIFLFGCSSQKYAVNKNFRTDKTFLNIYYNGKVYNIDKSVQFLDNDSLTISFRELPLEFALEKFDGEKLKPKFYYWKDYGDLLRRQFDIGLEKLKLTISTENPKIGEFIYGIISAETMPIYLDGKITQFKIKGKFKHQLK